MWWGHRQAAKHQLSGDDAKRRATSFFNRETSLKSTPVGKSRLKRNTKLGHTVTLEDLLAEKERGAKEIHDFQYLQISPPRDPENELGDESGKDIDEELVCQNPLLLQSMPALDIDIADLTLYLIDRAYHLWLIPLKGPLEESDCYVQNFSDEFHIISTYLMK